MRLKDIRILPGSMQSWFIAVAMLIQAAVLVFYVISFVQDTFGLNKIFRAERHSCVLAELDKRHDQVMEKEWGDKWLYRNNPR